MTNSADAKATSPTSKTQHSRGRPRAFDPKVGLERAKRLFWAKGLAGTSVADLTEALEITAPSIYAAFGDKRNLFREAVKSYIAEDASALLHALKAESVATAIHNVLTAAVELYAGPHSGKGCLVVTGAINCTPEDSEESEALKARRAELGDHLRKRLRQAAETGELKQDTDPDALAKFYHAFLNGLALRARDGDSAETLLATLVPGMLPLLAALTNPHPKKTRRNSLT